MRQKKGSQAIGRFRGEGIIGIHPVAAGRRTAVTFQPCLLIDRAYGGQRNMSVCADVGGGEPAGGSTARDPIPSLGLRPADMISRGLCPICGYAISRRKAFLPPYSWKNRAMSAQMIEPTRRSPRAGRMMLLRWIEVDSAVGGFRGGERRSTYSLVNLAGVGPEAGRAEAAPRLSGVG